MISFQVLSWALEQLSHCFQILKWQVSYRIKVCSVCTSDFLLLILWNSLVLFLKKINFCSNCDTHEWDVGHGLLWWMLGLFWVMEMVMYGLDAVFSLITFKILRQLLWIHSGGLKFRVFITAYQNVIFRITKEVGIHCEITEILSFNVDFAIKSFLSNTSSLKS